MQFYAVAADYFSNWRDFLCRSLFHTCWYIFCRIFFMSTSCNYYLDYRFVFTFYIWVQIVWLLPSFERFVSIMILKQIWSFLGLSKIIGNKYVAGAAFHIVALELQGYGSSLVRHHLAIWILSNFIIRSKYLAIATIVVVGVAFNVFFFTRMTRDFLN